MADTPGKLLSSLSNADGRPPKVGGYAGVFFQLFDWNRRFSGKHSGNKALPAERKNGGPKEDKLSMAKLLLIADENRAADGKPPTDECQSEVGSEKSMDSGSTKRPSVVARLMGLESLPDNTADKEVSKNEQQQQPPPQQQRKMNHYQELQILEDLFSDDQLHGWKPPKHNAADFLKQAAVPPAGSYSTREEKMPKNTKAEHHMEKFVPVSPKKSPFASILSPSKNKSPLKSQSGSSRRRALLMGAASKILEPAAASRTRPLLENKPSEPGDRGPRNKTLPTKDNKPVMNNTRNNNRECEEQHDCKNRRTQPSAKQAFCWSSSAPLLKEKNENSTPKLQAKVDVNEGLEQDDDTRSLESQTSSSKENHGTTESQAKGPAGLRRSGSVKEDQPPTPPSRGSLFRSKSVKEEQFAAPDGSSKRASSKPGKEGRLKNDSKRQRSSSQEHISADERTRRKPALDQGRKPSTQDVQQKDVKAKTAKRAGGQERDSLSSAGSSIGRLFGARKQSRKSSMDQPPDASTRNSEDATRVCTDEDSCKAKEEVPKKSNSLMKSLLRRKPISKPPEPVHGATKKIGLPQKTRSAYERQIRSAGSSPARTFNEANVKEVPECNLHLENLDESYASDPEVLQERESCKPQKPQPRTSFAKSMEDIVRSYCSEHGPMPKEFMSTQFMELVREGGDDPTVVEGDDPTVVDMDVSPVGNEAVVSRYDGIEDLPNKVLFEDNDDEQLSTTPGSPAKKNFGDTGVLPFSLDTSDSGKENNASGAAEDGGQPSPVSVLDFSALQSAFPSEVTTSSEDNDEDEKQALLSDADSAPLATADDSANTRVREETLLEILDAYDTRFTEVSSDLNEDVGSEEIELYVREVLIGAGLVTDSYVEAQARDSTPSSQDIAEMLAMQQQARGVESEMQLCSTPGSHKLMYGCIEEALNLVLAPFRNEEVDFSLQSLRASPRGEELVGMVTGYILAWRDMTPEAVDTLVELDMSMSSKQWSSLGDAVTEVAVDVERLIFRNLMEDVISDLVDASLRCIS